MNIVVGAVGLAAIHLSNVLDPPENYMERQEMIGDELVTIKPMSTEVNIERYSRYLQNFNTGIMRAL